MAHADGFPVAQLAIEGTDRFSRVLRILLSFTKVRHTLSSRDLAIATGIPLPTVYRYVAVLRDMGLLIRNDQGEYHLSAHFIALGQAAEAAEILIEIADPVMRSLASASGETVLLVRLVNSAALCVHRIESMQRLRISYEPGHALPLDKGASGRLLLASMSPAQRKDHLAPLWRQDPARAMKLERDVIAADERRWATSAEEIDSGIWAAAAAICDNRGIVAALSVPSPLVRAPQTVQDHLLSQVRSAAAEISNGLRRYLATTT